jgi:hypothetical protein
MGIPLPSLSSPLPVACDICQELIVRRRPSFPPHLAAFLKRLLINACHIVDNKETDIEEGLSCLSVWHPLLPALERVIQTGLPIV